MSELTLAQQVNEMDNAEITITLLNCLKAEGCVKELYTNSCKPGVAIWMFVDGSNYGTDWGVLDYQDALDIIDQQSLTCEAMACATSQ